MTEQNTQTPPPSGGQFLLDRVGTHAIFTPDDFTPDELAIGRTAEEFLEKEVMPFVEQMEKKDYDRLLKAFRKAGELGFFMASIPEKWGGLGLPKRVSLLISEKLAGYGSFSVTHGAHCGIGTLPIVYFGTPDQKERYLPQLATGERIGAYALSEPGSGSDALSAKTTAVLNKEGTHFVVNGTKQWISNGAFADVFTVFCQVVDPDGSSHFSALIIDRDTAGFDTGPEEHKLGLRGSSTTALIFEDALVPVGNLLGTKGRGHEIAFNILNVGRYTLAVSTTGGARHGLKNAISYASERKQFGRPIIEFGALRLKVATAAAEIYAMESLSYRIGGLTDAMRHSSTDWSEDAPGTVQMAPIEEYAIEASIGKVYCSEAVNRVVSEYLQMYGGYGYVEDYPAERAFRDARINMIFEGTNEINRLLIPGMLLKRALKGRLPLMDWLGSLAGGPGDSGTGPLASEVNAVQRFKGITGTVLGAAAMRYMKELEQHQQLLLLLSELVIDCYMIDSVVARSLQRHEKGLETEVSDAITRVLVAEVAHRSRVNAHTAICSFVEGPALEKLQRQLRRWEFLPTTNLVAERNVIADATIRAGRYNQSPT